MPHIPTPLEQLGRRPFSFYPAICSLSHNEWMFRGATGEEIEVENTKSKEILSIPRRFLGGVSSSEEPVVIVGLTKELEYREGVIVPRILRVIEMPRAVNDVARRPWAGEPPAGRLAEVEGIRVESNDESRRSRKLFGAVALGLLVCVIGMVILRSFYAAPVRLYLPFTASDDYASVIERWGLPDSSRSVSARDGSEYFLLHYRDRSLTVVLFGPDRNRATYIGSLSRGGFFGHSVMLPDGRNSADLLNRLR